MRKRLKFVLMCSIICIVVGAVLTGASYQFARKTYVPEQEPYAQNFDVEAIDNIVIKGAVASVYIQKGERFGIVAENIPKDTLICEISGNTLTVSTEEWHSSFNFNLGFIKFPNFPSMEGAAFTDWLLEETIIYLYIPDDTMFDAITFKENVGNINADDISCKTLEISSNVGNVTVDEFVADSLLKVNEGVGNVKLRNGVVNGNVDLGKRVGDTKLVATINGDVDIEGGVGNITLDSTIYGKVKVDGGVGNITLNGEIHGNITIDGGVGNTTLNLSGNPDDYSVHSDSGLGKVSYKNVHVNNPDAKYNIEIDGGVGNIRINID